MKELTGCVNLEEGAIGWTSWRKRHVFSTMELVI